MAVVALAGGVGCSGDDAGNESDGEAAEEEAPEDLVAEEVARDADDFYEVPDPIPAGEHGDLVRYQMVSDPPEGMTWYRVMYLSESLEGESIAVTGVVAVPDGEAPDDGWPLVTHGHGGVGIADDCSPSANLGTESPAALEIGVVTGMAAEKGYAVASSDYEGLGTPGRHPFLVGESEGRGMLDIAIAARQLPGVEAGPTTAISGYSQGGHAALWASQIAETWTPDLAIVGTVAGAPASEVIELVGQRTQAGDQGLFWVLLAGGLAAAHPEADPAEILSQEGLDLLDQFDNSCDETAPNLEPGVRLVQGDPAETQPWRDLAEANTPGATAAPAPVLIIHSAEDESVPVEHSATLLDRLCGVDQVAERRVLPGGDHVTSAVPAYDQGFDWFDALASGTEPVSSCG